MAIGLLVLRLAVGGALLLQGSSKLTPRGRRGTAAFFGSVGFSPPAPLALVAAVSEVGAGVLLGLGFATPLAAAGAVGVLVSASTVAWRNGYWNSGGGAEYTLVLTLAAAAIAFTGPGSISVDRTLGWSEPGTAAATAAVILGALSAMPLLVRRPRQLELRGAASTAVATAR